MSEPTHYTALQGGDWIVWTAGNVDGRTLKKRSRTSIDISGQQVHAIKFDDGKEWDCINGWRQSAPEVKSEAAAAPAVDDKAERAQAYAMRVWAGQSDSIGRTERIARVKRALEGQNLPTDAIRFPGSDDDDWDEEDMQPVTWRKRA